MVSSDSTRKPITVMIVVILRKINIVVKESVELLTFQRKTTLTFLIQSTLVTRKIGVLYLETTKCIRMLCKSKV